MPSMMPRALSSMPAITSSLTALALAPGVLKTTIPCRLYSADRYIVHAGPGAGDGEQRGGNFDALELLAAQEKSVRVGDVAADFVRLTRKTIKALDRDLVVGSDLVHGNLAQ
jgi:hypothetical protein